MNRKKQSLQPGAQASVVAAQKTGLAFTGERYVPTEQGEIRLEHFHRYAVALDIVAGKDVLDIASGEGYGSFLLATVARNVTGVDISQEAVQHARATYSDRSNLTFKQGSATKINLPDHTFDVVISFETIEHLAEQSEMLSEIRRVLKPTGVLLISSPNRPIYSEASGTHNEFHVKELDFRELDSLLRKQFNAIRYLGQRLLIGSIVQPLDGIVSSLRALCDKGVNVQKTAGTLSEPVYFLALCAATEAAIPTIDASIMQPDKLDLLKQYIGYAKWAINSNKELDVLRKLHGELNEEHHKVATWAQSLDRQVSTVTQALSEREQQIAMFSDKAIKHNEWAEKVAERERVFIQEHAVLQNQSAERERELHDRLLAGQTELRKVEREWAEKVASQQDKLLIQQQNSATLQAQLQDQIHAAKQLAAHWELAQDALRFEVDIIKSSLTWRLTAPLRKFGRWNLLVTSDKATSARHRTFDVANVNLADSRVEVDHQDKTERHKEEVRMTINSMVPANFPKASIASLDDLLDYHDEAFVSAAYQTLLRRAPDAEGLAYYVRRLRRGVGKLQILDQIYRSSEAQICAVKLPGLEDALRRNRWHKLPVIGVMLRKQDTNQKLHALENQLFLLNESNGRRFDQKEITLLRQMISQQAQIAAGVAAIHRLGYSLVDSWATVEELLSFEGVSFVGNLFQLTLGRPPDAHETDHYLDILGKGASKLHIIELVFSCAECKTRQAVERVVAAQADDKIIPHAVVNRGVTQPAVVVTESIHFVEYEKPLVSVVIPVYGKIEYTLMCLKSIQEHLPEVEFEIIIVDDKSRDNTVTELSKVRGIKLVLNTENLGFIRSCNRGAEHAEGQYLCFLNNDTKVCPGWLDELVRTFHEFPGAGLVGSKFIYPNGTLQEAGGIIWQDGSAWNFGRNQDPQLPVYNYAREVDYCSGASIMVPKALFEELRGFDEYYLPAYCEDSDLALKVRDKGHRVIYQPMSTIIHFEGITSGTDTSQGTKAYQIENSKKLFERWKHHLKGHQAPGMDVDEAKDRRATRRVLVIDHCTPTPNNDAGSVTVFNLMMLLREMDFQVTFIPEDNFLFMPEYTTALQRVGIEVLYAPYVTSVQQHLKDHGERYALALLFRPMVVERHLKTIRTLCPKVKVLFHTVDLHFLRMSREAELQSDKAKQKAAVEMKQRELAAIRASDASIVHSTAELELLRSELPDAKLHLFPLIMDVQGTSKTFSERRDIVFVGGYQHTPNVDAVQYFVKEIMPQLRSRLSRVRFHAVGSKPPPEIQALASEDVIITGFVEDLAPLLAKMRVSIAPLRYGAGIKGKIGLAMALGLPVVATPLAAEGMSLTDGENILVADDEEAFADTVAKIYKDEALWNRISRNGLEFADNAWGAEAACKILNEILTDISINATRGVYPLSLYSGPDMAQKEIKKQPNKLTPIASIKSRENYILALDSDLLRQISAVEKTLIESTRAEAFAVDGYCVPCNKNVSFLVDMQSGGQRQDIGWLPNWRERLECPLCRMNNRQRLIATLVTRELGVHRKKHVYFMEQVTPIYNWAIATFKNHNTVGSEYLGHEYEGGAIIKGIRHEDVNNLSFSDGALDLIVSNDVFEHVPNPARAFAECARVLKEGGVMLATIPFHRNIDESITRARIIDGQLEHVLPPLYHGNPVSADGSLVFTDFGWDVLQGMQAAGFSDVSVGIYASVELGHLGGGQLVFEGIK